MDSLGFVLLIAAVQIIVLFFVIRFAVADALRGVLRDAELTQHVAAIRSVVEVLQTRDKDGGSTG